MTGDIDREFYKNQANSFRAQACWSIESKLLARYHDVSHTKKDADGTLYWCENYRRHRCSGPAVIYQDGTLKWRKDGE